MKLFQKFGAGLEKAVAHVARARVREQLLRFDDRLLEDAGFSRDMLNAGIDQWPWRAKEDNASLPRPVFQLPPSRIVTIDAPESQHRDAA